MATHEAPLGAGQNPTESLLPQKINEERQWIGMRRGLIDLSTLPTVSRVTADLPNNPLEAREVAVMRQEVIEGRRAPVEIPLSGRHLAEQLGILVSAGYKIALEKERSCITHLRDRIHQADVGIITEETLPFTGMSPEEKQAVLPPLNSPKRDRDLVRTALRGATAAIVIPGAFYGGAQLLNVEATQVPDLYGPEITRAQLEANPQSITATDYVEDAGGNVIKQRAVVNGRLYESDRDQATGTFKDGFRLVSTIPMGNVTSLISSADGNTLIAGGEDPIRSANTKLVISFNGGISWENISWPYPACGSVIDLIRFTDSNYFGNNGNWEGCRDSQFTLRADPVLRTASVQAVNLSVQSTNLSIGSAHDLRVASVAGNNVQMYSAGSLNLQAGFVGVDMDYTTGIGTARQITQTVIGGQLINLGSLMGSGVYTDSSGHLRLEGSNYMRQIIYDINPFNPLDGTATQFYYANLLDNVGIPNYIPGSLTIQAIGAQDADSNRISMLAGGYNSTLDGNGRAVLVNRNTRVFNDLSPNTAVWSIFQKGMLRKKIGGQMGYELIIRGPYGFGKVFVPDGGMPAYTDRGLGVFYRLLLPFALRN